LPIGDRPDEGPPGYAYVRIRVPMRVRFACRLDAGQFRFGFRRPLRRASAASTPKR
jgi:hypothetical protein